MENSYEQLIDDYNNGILVEAGESLTDYISRMGGVNYPDKKANGGIITALRIGLANGSLSPDELAALEEEVKQNPTMVNEITDIEFGVNKPGPATDQGPYPMDNEKRDLIISMLEMGTDVDIIKQKTNASDEEMGEAISVFKYGGAGVPLPSFDSSGKMTDDGLYKGQLKSFKADGGIMRVDLSEGTPSKRDELVERFGVKSDLLKKVYPLFMDEDGDYRKALQIAKYELSKFISGKGTDLDTGAEWYNKLDKDTQKEILEEKIKIREERPEMYKKFDIKPSPQMVEEMEMPVYDEEYAGKYGIGGRYADGGVAGILKV